MADEFITLKLEGKGLEEAAKRLRSLGPELRQKILEKSVRAAVTTWVRDARRRAARSSVPHVVRLGGQRTTVAPGNMARMISVRKVRSGKFSLSNEAAFGVVLRRLGFYWRWIELGKQGFAAKPFLKPAFDLNVAKSFEVVASSATKFIEQHLQRR